MGFLAQLFGSRKNATAGVPEHAVIVHFQYGSTDVARLFALEEQLEKAIAAASAGEYDGNEVAVDGSDGFLYMYGPDADALFAAIRSTLEATAFMNGARVKLRYGPPKDGVRVAEIVLKAHKPVAENDK
jgi:hypothetical protein